jgi:alpha-L-rhamnosidase
MQTTITNLRCEQFENPVGIDREQPRLSWRLETGRRGARQTAYRITVSSQLGGPADLWDSGRVESDHTSEIPYQGTALTSGQRAHWRVEVWDETDASNSSPDAWWEVGLLNEGDWTAQWIGSSVLGGPRTSAPAPYLRKAFALDKPVTQARLYVTALGIYEAEINGQRVGDQVLAPGWTDYRKQVRYQTYDVTDLLQAGENGIGAVLGDGWYAGSVEWRGRQLYGDRPKLLAQLVVTHDDGSTTVVATDDSWRTSLGPILQADLLQGQHVDARLDLGAWTTAAYDDSKWQPVQTFPKAEGKLVAQNSPPVRVTEEIHPIAEPKTIHRWPANDHIFDLGQNMVGWVRLRVKGPAGTTIRIRFGEVLDDKGNLYTENLRSAQQTDFYTLRGGDEVEVFEPRLTFHGFRYVEVRGYPGDPKQDDLVGVVVHSDYPATGTFECSNPLINQLQHNIWWGWRGNSVDVPTDCPQRDERLGWTGDAQVFVRTAAYLAQVETFFEKYQQDLEDSQNEKGSIPPIAPDTSVVGGDGGPAWADAFVICPWTLYLCYGDKAVLERHYDSMKAFIGYLQSISRDYIRSYQGYEGFAGFGDWLSINAETPSDLIGTAFSAYSTELMARIAEVLGKSEDATEFWALHEKIKAAFNDRFVTPGGVVASGTQTAYLLALHFDLLPPELREKATEALVHDIKKRGTKLSTGFVGSPYLNHVLTANGRNDVAFDLLNQQDWPSWLYAVTKGATTIWERWDGWTHDKGFQDASMNSFNHYAYGAIGAWLYQSVAGIDVDPAQPGYKHIVMKPDVGGGLTYAKASYDSVHGRIESSWRTEDGRFEWDVTVPPNATATAYLPTKGVAPEVEGAERLGQEADRTLYRLPAGTYHFSTEM